MSFRLETTWGLIFDATIISNIDNLYYLIYLSDKNSDDSFQITYTHLKLFQVLEIEHLDLYIHYMQHIKQLYQCTIL